MTGLPRARASEIREELEDHLRARVDDLMITGLTEPEAVQQAVNELGETAHLAKQFRTALKPHLFKTNRNTLMQTALIAIAGSALTFGILSSTNGTSSLHGVPPHAATDSAASNATVPAHAIGNLTDQTYGGLFDQLAMLTDTPVLVHWDRLEDIGVIPETMLDLNVDTLPSDVLYRLIRERTAAAAGDPLTVEDTPELIEFSTQSHFDRRSITIQTHDVESLVDYYEVPQRITGADGTPVMGRDRTTAERAGLEVIESIIGLASRNDWTDRGGDLASARFVGNSLIIDAPARIHTEVQAVITMMEAEVAKYRAQQREAQEAMVEAKQRQLAHLVSEMDTLTAELNMLDSQVSKHHVESEALYDEQRTLGVAEIQPVNLPHRDPAEVETENQRRREVRNAISEHVSVMKHQQMLAQDKRAYREAVRERLIDLKYEPLLFEQELTAKRNRENAERRAERAARRNGSN